MKNGVKNSFRQKCLKAKKFNRYYVSKIIAKEIEKIAKDYKKILFFLPLKNEVDVFPLLNKLRRKKHTIFVPFMEDLSFKMVKYGLPLKKKKFSILEPLNKNKTLEKVDLAIVPVVGIDRNFKRLGFGKGMYDRFFEKLNYKPKILFVQLRPCIFNGVLSEKHDIKGDFYITYKIRSKNVDRFANFYRITSGGVFDSKTTR